MKYQCLVLDHDDTAVDSTATIHYPAHVEMMSRLRPDEKVVSLNTWFEKNFDPGIMAFLTEELALDEREMDEEFRIWQEFNDERNPPFYDGLLELLKEFVAAGGIIAVVSHSAEKHIRRHYGISGVEPTYVFGWDHDPERRKPSTWPVEQIMAASGLNPEDMLVVDDLKPGADMARKAGIKVAAAGWGHSIPSIQEAMKQLCDFWLPDIQALRDQIFA